MQPSDRSDVHVILVNLGTPAAPTAPAVRRYLREFLGDRRVVELPRLPWWLLLNLVILVTRPSRVARSYAAIWTDAGSPLRVYTESLARQTGDAIADSRIRVHAAMTYGEPSLSGLLRQLESSGSRRVLVLPLYPQQSATTTGAVVDVVARHLLRSRSVPDVRIVTDYADEPAYIEALAASVREFQAREGTAGRILFSFHGIPRSYAERGDPYPVRCAKTAALLSARLGLEARQWELVYQSRFGRQPWLMPYLDERLRALPGEGVESVQVVCPGFATDCLETIEEVAVENRERFMHAGGKRYAYIPALNDSAAHAALLAGIVRTQTAGWR